MQHFEIDRCRLHYRSYRHASWTRITCVELAIVRVLSTCEVVRKFVGAIRKNKGVVHGKIIHRYHRPDSRRLNEQWTKIFALEPVFRRSFRERTLLRGKQIDGEVPWTFGPSFVLPPLPNRKPEKCQLFL